MYMVKKTIKLPVEDSGMQANIVRFHNSMIDSKKLDKRRFFRREALVIYNPETGNKVIRYAMGNPGISGLSKDAIAIDYDALDDLDIKYGELSVDLVVKRANLFQQLRWFWMHKDLNIRFSMRLAVMSGILGVIGLVNGL